MNQPLKLIVAVALVAPAAVAHHILGVPHYAYDEDYPQTPVLTYSVEAGPYNVRMTGYPGMPEPGQACSLHVYLSHIVTNEPYRGHVTLSVMRDRLVGTDPIVYGPVKAELEEAMFKFFPVFKDEANYTVRIEYEAEDAPWIIDLPIVAGEPGSPWTVIGVISASVLAFLVVVRAIRIKIRRGERSRQSHAASHSKSAAGNATS